MKRNRSKLIIIMAIAALLLVPTAGFPIDRTGGYLAANALGALFTGPVLEAGWLLPGGWQLGVHARFMGAGLIYRLVVESADQAPMLGSFSAGFTVVKLFPLRSLPFELYLGLSVEPMATAVTVDPKSPYEIQAGQYGGIGVASLGSRFWLNEKLFLDIGATAGAGLIAANAWYYTTYPVEINWDYTPTWFFVGSADLTLGVRF